MNNHFMITFRSVLYKITLEGIVSLCVYPESCRAYCKYSTLIHDYDPYVETRVNYGVQRKNCLLSSVKETGRFFFFCCHFQKPLAQEASHVGFILSRCPFVWSWESSFSTRRKAAIKYVKCSEVWHRTPVKQKKKCASKVTILTIESNSLCRKHISAHNLGITINN